MPESDVRTDQASGLRRAKKPKPVRVISITGGKGGVGKTNVSVNLATAFAQSGKHVMLMDADLGLANVDVLLGLYPKLNLSNVLNGERTLEEVIIDGPCGMKIVPSASGLQDMTALSSAVHAGLIRAFSDLSHDLDVLIIDTAAGISDGVTSFCRAAQEVVIVVCDEPASITDAYALIKVLNREYEVNRFRVLANMTRETQEGFILFKKLLKATDRFLDVTLDFMGAVPYDEYLRRAVQKQRAVVDLYPRCKSAIAFKHLVQKADNWPVPNLAGGHVEFFIERLILSNRNPEVAST